MSLIFTVTFLFFLMISALCFYALLNKYLGKQCGYFFSFYYRTFSGMCMLTTGTFVRRFVQGAAHFFLYHNYGYLMIALSCLEILIVVLMIALQKRHKIVVSSLDFCLHVLYHFLFVIVNLSLYFCYFANNFEQE